MVMARSKRILLVDDDPHFGTAASAFFSRRGLDVDVVTSCAAAAKQFRESPPDLAVLDYELPDGDSVSLLPELLSTAPLVPILVITGYATVELAVEAMRKGAGHFLTKPIQLEALFAVVERMLSSQQAQRYRVAAKTSVRRWDVDPFLGGSPKIELLRDRATAVAKVDMHVLITGETGTGKTVLARWLHANSSRADEPFVELNCAGLSRELLESELFGHAKGAFTGAVATKTGLLEVAHRGTLFLDEIGDMDLQVQAKLLKVVEDMSFRRVGEVTDRRVDVRLIAATHHDLTQLVQQKLFRQDLYYRISALPLAIPALRERQQDLPVLLNWMLERLACDMGKEGFKLSHSCWEQMQDYTWPGNLRELRNVLERAVLLEQADVELTAAARVADCAPQIRPTAGIPTLQELIESHIQFVLDHENGNVAKAAARLGIARSSLYAKLKGSPLAPEAS
jgi:DNA-binding NtrC family response regulator